MKIHAQCPYIVAEAREGRECKWIFHKRIKYINMQQQQQQHQQQ